MAGVASVHAVPMRLRNDVLGALNLFGATPGTLNEADLRLAQALSDVATIALIQNGAAAAKDAGNEQLQNALDSRVVLEQAKGVLATAVTWTCRRRTQLYGSTPEATTSKLRSLRTPW